jgi:hypothetical protein
MEALARLAWEQYRQRAPLLTALWLIALAGAAVPVGAVLGLGALVAWLLPGFRLQLMTGCTVAGIVGGLAGMGMGLGALIAAVADPDADIRVALYRGRRLWWPTVLVLWMTAGLAAGGTVLFIVPGLLVLLGACSALFIMFIERETALMALMKSFEYMKGRTADSALKLLPVAVMAAIALLLLSLVPAVAVTALLIVSLAVMPFLSVYLHRLFENLRGVNGRIVIFQVSSRVRMRWIAAAAAGAAAPLIMSLLLWQLGQAGNAFHLLASLI